MKQPVITEEFLAQLFPASKADDFFEALYGGAEAGAFDIALLPNGFDPDSNTIILEFRLTERPGKCMACNLTYGLPQVFERHPVINIQEIVSEIEKKIAPSWSVKGWQIGRTSVIDAKTNSIPLFIQLEKP